jgi:ABC-type transport system involved in cytochrome bd biosynthesis fused ATPase/permease subunit
MAMLATVVSLVLNIGIVSHFLEFVGNLIDQSVMQVLLIFVFLLLQDHCCRAMLVGSAEEQRQWQGEEQQREDEEKVKNINELLEAFPHLTHAI